MSAIPEGWWIGIILIVVFYTAMIIGMWWSTKKCACPRGHDWSGPWITVFDKYGCITGYYIKECKNVRCRRVRAIFNYNKQPEDL